jgi:drug/metabolite transporter (DMT)-like permease
VVVQTLVATTPLFVLIVEAIRARESPSGRAVLASLIVLVGVVVILLG